MTFTDGDFVLIGVTFLFAGGVKGVIGLGLPTVSLGVLTAAFDLTTAMALMVIPSFVTNLWQGVVGGHLASLFGRLWPFLLLATGAILLGAGGLSRFDLGLLSALLGLLLVVYAVLALSGLRLTLPKRSEPWAGPLFGLVNGVLTGLTGSFVVPGVMYLQALGLTRDQLVQAMGILFTMSTVALAVALGAGGYLSAQQGTVGIAALVPALVGMVLGQRLRARLPEAVFRRVFFAAILVLGAYIISRALLG